MAYRPPYVLSFALRERLREIIRLIGRIEGCQLLSGNVRLRRENQIKSLHSSLAIEGNSLSESQVTALLEGKPVMGPPRDILEVQHALRVYEKLPKTDAFSEDELLATHGTLMRGLIPDAGRYRAGGIGVMDGKRVVHVAPPARQVPRLMGELFDYLCNYEEDIIIKSCVFHYEFEFIHPFSDGNGRMGRLWQTAILKSEYPDLVALPLESMVRERQQAYYSALQQCQKEGTSNPFITYALNALHDTLLRQLETVGNIPSDAPARLQAFQDKAGKDGFTRKEYLAFHKRISPATATRDLTYGVEQGVLRKEGRMSTTRYGYDAS